MYDSDWDAPPTARRRCPGGEVQGIGGGGGSSRECLVWGKGRQKCSVGLVYDIKETLSPATPSHTLHQSVLGAVMIRHLH